jgi:hypothetical protein
MNEWYSSLNRSSSKSGTEITMRIIWWKKNQRNAFFKVDHIFKTSTRSYMFRHLRYVTFREPKVILPNLCVCYVILLRLLLLLCHFFNQDFNYRYNFFIYSHGVYLVLILAYDVEYTQFRQDTFGIPEDGATKEPKHVGASWYFKYMVYFEKCISLVFLPSYFENAWSKLQNHAHNLMRQFP